MDGFGLDYYRGSPIPFIHSMAEKGFFREVKGLFPSLTNVNNISIATGEWPVTHGISANSLYDPTTGKAVYLNASSAIKAPTILERARARGVRSALLTSKRKTKELFEGRADIVFAAEEPTAKERELFGNAPPIYSLEINHYLFDCAAKLLSAMPDIGIVYVHTTDYPMHAWPPGHPDSDRHLAGVDARLEAICAANGDLSVFMTADHGMRFKKRCWNLKAACAERGLYLRFALSPERDYYTAHHNNYSGCAWLWLERQEDREEARRIIEGLEGVEAVRDSAEVAEEHRLDQAHLGDLVVLGDADTMFGDCPGILEELPPSYRAHGSLHEMELPLIVYNYLEPMPPPEHFRKNMDLCSSLYPLDHSKVTLQ